MEEESWDEIVTANNRGTTSTVKKLWQYRDLLRLIVRRDFIAFYRQTILGPLWFFIKPMASALIYLFVFGAIAGLPSDGIPAPLFYLTGTTLWGFFSETVNMGSNVLKSNAGMFGKVYFPRLIMPIGIVLSNSIRLAIQLVLILFFYIYFFATTGSIDVGIQVLLTPLILLIVALQALGLGLFVSAISIKYRDASMLIGYALQLGLFLSPVVYPLSTLTGNFRLLLLFNPMTYPIELFRFALFGTGEFSITGITYMAIITTILLFTGVTSFNKAEKNFVDII